MNVMPRLQSYERHVLSVAVIFVTGAVMVGSVVGYGLASLIEHLRDR